MDLPGRRVESVDSDLRALLSLNLRSSLETTLTLFPPLSPEPLFRRS
jgi:hypothetical protein